MPIDPTSESVYNHSIFWISVNTARKQSLKRAVICRLDSTSTIHPSPSGEWGKDGYHRVQSQGQSIVRICYPQKEGEKSLLARRCYWHCYGLMEQLPVYTTVVRWIEDCCYKDCLRYSFFTWEGSSFVDTGIGTDRGAYPFENFELWLSLLSRYWFTNW